MRNLARITQLFAVLAILFVPVTRASAQGGYAASDRFGYSGTVTKYNSLTDLQNNVGGTTSNFPARDLGLYFVNGNTGFAGAFPPIEAEFLSAWYLNNGNTPSNSNVGFIQLADVDGSTLTSQSESWLNADKTAFSFSATGTNSVAGGCNTTADCSRLWDGTNLAGNGSFASYSLGFTATGLDPAILTQQR
jgi:hypothetical protein